MGKAKDGSEEIESLNLRTLEVNRIKALRKEFRAALERKLKASTISRAKSGWLPSINSIGKDAMSLFADFLRRYPNETVDVLTLVMQDREPSTQQEELIRQLDKVRPLMD